MLAVSIDLWYPKSDTVCDMFALFVYFALGLANAYHQQNYFFHFYRNATNLLACLEGDTYQMHTGYRMRVLMCLDCLEMRTPPPLIRWIESKR